MKAVFFSDLHLTKVSEAKYQKFLELLHEIHIKEKPDAFYLLGDIMDVMIGNFKFWEKIHKDLFLLLKEISKSSKVYWVQGNHDFCIEELLSRYNIESSDSYFKHNFAGTHCLMGHGDLVNDKESSYIKWRALTRSEKFHRWVHRIPELLGRYFFYPLTLAYSQSRKRRFSPVESAKFKFQKFANIKFQENFGAVFLGHSHIFDHYKVKNKFYLNLGYWSPKQGRYCLWESHKEPEIIEVNY